MSIDIAWKDGTDLGTVSNGVLHLHAPRTLEWWGADGCEKHLSVLETDRVRPLEDVDRENKEHK